MTATRLSVPKTIVLVGLMGAGKSCVGRRLATVLGLPFIDADKEIEEAAGCSIPDLFSRYGEAAFRDGERRVIHRLLKGPLHVLATGGGAFIDPGTRAEIRAKGISIWLRADLELLVRGQRSPRRLLAIPQGGVEDVQTVHASPSKNQDCGLSGPTDLSTLLLSTFHLA